MVESVVGPGVANGSLRGRHEFGTRGRDRAGLLVRGRVPKVQRRELSRDKSRQRTLDNFVESVHTGPPRQTSSGLGAILPAYR